MNNKKGYDKELVDDELIKYIGTNGEIVKNPNDNQLYIFDGKKKGGFPLKHNSNLTIDGIINELSVRGLLNGDVTPTYKTLSNINSRVLDDGKGAWWMSSLRQETEVINYIGGAKGFLLPKNDNTSVWGNFKIPNDFVIGSGLNVFIDWSSDSEKSGTVRFGVEYAIAKPNQEQAFLGTQLLYIDYNVSKNEKGLVTTTLNESDFIFSNNLEPGSLLLINFFRVGEVDSFKDDIVVFNSGIEYLGAINEH